MKLIILYFIDNDIKLVSEKLTTPISIDGNKHAALRSRIIIIIANINCHSDFINCVVSYYSRMIL